MSEIEAIIRAKAILVAHKTLGESLYNDAVDLAVNALKKQIPKAMKYDHNDLNMCPSCNQHIKTDDKFCIYCGQAVYVDWSDE